MLKIILLGICSLIPIYGQSACNANAIATGTSSGIIVASTGANKYIRICAIYIQVVQPSSSPGDFGLTQGTGSVCGTNETNLSPQWAGVASSIQEVTIDIPTNAELNSTAGKDVCVKLSASPTSIKVWIFYRVLG